MAAAVSTASGSQQLLQEAEALLRSFGSLQERFGHLSQPHSAATAGVGRADRDRLPSPPSAHSHTHAHSHTMPPHVAPAGTPSSHSHPHTPSHPYPQPARFGLAEEPVLSQQLQQQQQQQGHVRSLLSSSSSTANAPLTSEAVWDAPWDVESLYSAVQSSTNDDHGIANPPSSSSSSSNVHWQRTALSDAVLRDAQALLTSLRSDGPLDSTRSDATVTLDEPSILRARLSPPRSPSHLALRFLSPAEAASALQRAARGYLARKRTARRRRYKDAAITIQRCW
jgi:hypothetical protein